MARNLKIGADISGAKQSLKELSGILNSKEFQGQGAKIVDTKHIEYIKKEGGKAIEVMNKELKKQDELLVKLAGYAEDNTKSDKVREAAAVRYNRVMKKRLDLSKDVVRSEKAHNSLIENATKLQRFGAKAQGMGGILSKIPGMGKIGGLMGRGGGLAAGGMGLGAMGGMAMGGLALGGLAFGASRAMRGNEVFKQGTDTRQNLRSLNVRNVSGRHQGLQELGMTPQEVREAQEQRARTFGGSAAKPNDILNTARISKLKGVSMEQMGGAAESLRANLGVTGGQKAFMKLQATLLSSGINDALGPYLETAANMLTSMNENGLSLSDDALTLFSAVMGDGKKISAERAGKIITGIDQNIKGASGEQAGFIDFIMASGGVKGKGLLGQQLIREGGITGFGEKGDLANKGLGKDELKAFDDAGALGKNVGAKARVKALVSFYDQQKAEQGTLGALSTMQGAVGGRGLVDTAQIMESLRVALASKDEGKVKKVLKNMEEGKMPLDAQQVAKLESILKSVDGTNKAIEAASQANLDALGERVQAPIQMANRFLNSIDKNISHILGWLPGFTTEEEKRTEEIDDFVNKSAAGETSSADLKALNLSPEEKEKMQGDLQKRIASQGGRAAMLKKSADKGESGDEGLLGKFMSVFSRSNQKDAEVQVSMLGLLLEELKKGNENTAKLANKRGTSSVSGGNSGKRGRK